MRSERSMSYKASSLNQGALNINLARSIGMDARLRCEYGEGCEVEWEC